MAGSWPKNRSAVKLNHLLTSGRAMARTAEVLRDRDRTRFPPVSPGIDLVNHENPIGFVLPSFSFVPSRRGRAALQRHDLPRPRYHRGDRPHHLSRISDKGQDRRRMYRPSPQCLPDLQRPPLRSPFPRRASRRGPGESGIQSRQGPGPRGEIRQSHRRIPACLRTDLDTIWIHDGVEPFGGGNRNLLIHEGQAALYRVDGILEETFVPRGLPYLARCATPCVGGMAGGQSSDGEFLSTYARDNPRREDVAETFLMWWRCVSGPSVSSKASSTR